MGLAFGVVRPYGTAILWMKTQIGTRRQIQAEPKASACIDRKAVPYAYFIAQTQILNDKNLYYRSGRQGVQQKPFPIPQTILLNLNNYHNKLFDTDRLNDL